MADPPPNNCLGLTIPFDLWVAPLASMSLKMALPPLGMVQAPLLFCSSFFFFFFLFFFFFVYVKF
jgi:hypothetical protein